jgi:hypothetical protein
VTVLVELFVFVDVLLTLFLIFKVLRFAVAGVFGFAVAGVLRFVVAGVLGFAVAGVLGFVVAGVFGFAVAGVLGFAVAGVFGFAVAGVFGFAVAGVFRVLGLNVLGVFINLTRFSFLRSSSSRSLRSLLIDARVRGTLFISTIPTQNNSVKDTVSPYINEHKSCHRDRCVGSRWVVSVRTPIGKGV